MQKLERKLAKAVQSYFDQGWLYGMVVGIETPKGVSTFGFGRVSSKDKSVPDGDTVFEIGSITKTFTATLLAEMVGEKKLSLRDPAEKHLPRRGRPPRHGKRKINLLELATHTSGMPGMPDDHRWDMNKLHPDYPAAKMYRQMRRRKLLCRPGKAFNYSNMGYGLLGHILELRSGQSYEELLKRHIFEPLGMASSAVTLTPGLKRRFAQAWCDDGFARPRSDVTGALAGAGGIRSTVNDLLVYLRAQRRRSGGGILAAMRLTHKPRFQGWSCLGWQVSGRRPLAYGHSGGTGGFRSFATFLPGRGASVVVLATTSSGWIPELVKNGIIASLTGGKPSFPRARKLVRMSPAKLRQYVGKYSMPVGSADATPVVKLVRGRLMLKLWRQWDMVLWPVGKDRLLVRADNRLLQFMRGKDGRVNGFSGSGCHGNPWTAKRLK